MKKYILSILLCLHIAVPYIFTETIPSRPSVEDVFGGLTEDQIAEQVKEGQRFLEELEKNGTPEEKAEFERLLMETLESMTEEDFNNITQIAQMVEPHLDLPKEEVKSKVETKDESKSDRTVVADNDVEIFQNFIGSITECIDQLLQKMQSSKGCSEYANTKWGSKTTFNSMKRQIYQLRTLRLAQKLSKKELSADDKELVATLKEFLKDITAQNDTFVIEDNFGLPTTLELEKKYLQKTQTILSVFDNYIDTIMPMLEKFLRKWDPEALELSKEAEARSKSALESATTAEKFVAQKPATAAPSEPRRGGSSSGSNGGYGSSNAGYSNSYDYPYDNQSPSYSKTNESNFSGGNQGKAPVKKADDQSAAKPKDDKATEKSTLSPYEYVSSEIAEHVHDLFDNKYEQKFVDYINGIVTNYPQASQLEKSPPTTIIRNEADQIKWLDTDFDGYVHKVKESFTAKFAPEFKHLGQVLETTKKKMSEMTTDDLKSLQNNKDLDTLSKRIERYKSAYAPVTDALNTKKQQNTTSQQAPSTSNNQIFKEKIGEYTQRHQDLLEYLDQKINDGLSGLEKEIENIKRKAKRTESTLRSNAAKKQAKATTVAPAPIVAAA